MSATVSTETTHVQKLLSSVLDQHGDFSVPSKRTGTAKETAVKILASVDSGEAGKKDYVNS